MYSDNNVIQHPDSIAELDRRSPELSSDSFPDVGTKSRSDSSLATDEFFNRCSTASPPLLHSDDRTS